LAFMKGPVLKQNGSLDFSTGTTFLGQG